MTDQQIDKIGRTETLKMLLVAATLTIVLPTLFGFIYVAIDCGLHCLNFNAVTETLGDKWTYIYISVSGLILSLIIYFLGPWTAQQIIKENKNKFFIGAATFFCLWTVLLFLSETIFGIQTSLQTGKYWLSIIMDDGWLPVTIIVWAFIAIPTSMIFGYFLGRQVKKKYDKLASL